MKNKLEKLYSIGRPLSPFYGYLMKIREKCYNWNLLKSHKLPVPVISIGNLMVGGTGKTPMVRYIAGKILAEKMKPAIISRGYGGAAKKRVNVVSDGKRLLLDAEMAGDEPYMLATSLPKVPVITGTKRVYPAQYAVDNLSANTLILDDGLQHLSLKRDIDIVLFDSTVLAGNSRILPGGPLREPVSALKRASCFVMTGTTAANEERAGKFADLLRERFPETPLFMAYRTELQLSHPNGTPFLPADGEKAFAFSAIASPERFYQSLEEIEVPLCGKVSFADHARYTEETVKKLEEKANLAQADFFVTTEKDATKLSNRQFNKPLAIATFSVQIGDDFNDFLTEKLNNLGKPVENNTI